MMGDDFFDFAIKFIAVDHHHIATSQTHDFDVGPNADDLESFAPSKARMGPFHLHFIIKVILRDLYHGSSSMTSARGTFGKPGIVKMVPVKGMMKPEPVARLTSRTWILKPLGAP